MVMGSGREPQGVCARPLAFLTGQHQPSGFDYTLDNPSSASTEAMGSRLTGSRPQIFQSLADIQCRDTWTGRGVSVVLSCSYFGTSGVKLWPAPVGQRASHTNTSTHKLRAQGQSEEPGSRHTTPRLGKLTRGRAGRRIRPSGRSQPAWVQGFYFNLNTVGVRVSRDSRSLRHNARQDTVTPPVPPAPMRQREARLERVLSKSIPCLATHDNQITTASQ